MSIFEFLKLKMQGRTWKVDGIRVVVSKQALEVIRKQ